MIANSTFAPLYDEERSAKSAERMYYRTRIDLADAPSGGGVGVTEGGEGLIGGIVGAAAGVGGRFVADDGTR